jgi:hypothetical protein
MAVLLVGVWGSEKRNIKHFEYFGYQVDSLFSWTGVGRMLIPIRGTT